MHSSMISTTSDEDLSYITPEIIYYHPESALEGKWEEVKIRYKNNPACHTAKINDTVGTALHVAVDLNEESVVKELVDAIITHRVGVAALEIGNEHGDTPLHVAAMKGLTKICMCIIGMNKERVYLATQKNKYGETPLFQAANNGEQKTFAYLSNILGNNAPLDYLKRYNGDTILHYVIGREYFDLAVIIVHYFEILSILINEKGFTPLDLLATRPSAFESACKFSWWKRIMYQCIIVKPMNPTTQMKEYLAEMEEQQNSNLSYPKNLATLYDFLARSVLALVELKELKNLKETKKRHVWSGQLLKALMKSPYAFTGSGGVPTDMEVNTDVYSVYSQFKQGETSEGAVPTDMEVDTDMSSVSQFKQEVDEERPLSRSETMKKETEQLADEKGIDKKETAFLVAARNGIVEMVDEIYKNFPSTIHHNNSKKQNVLHVAVISRQPLVVESLKKKLMQSKQKLWNNLILAVDKNESTMLHLAAYAAPGNHPWQVAGSALQMTWDTKWFQYIKSLVPQYYYVRSDRNSQTAGEIFEEKHTALIKESGDWLKDTSESCSVVAALVAGVSFATAGSIPGGTDDKGKPNLEGDPAFDVFAIASLVGLFFSVTGLIMFLTILTSRKQAKDFRKDLPLKLLLGLSSLFVSIASMFVSFCTGHFFLLSHNYKMVLYPIYAATCFPVTFYAVAQFPLYFDILRAILTKVPRASDKGDSA